MTLTTKLNRLDPIFFLHEGKVLQSVVRSVKVQEDEQGTFITYYCNNDPHAMGRIQVNEQHAFKSKEELIESL